LEKDKKRERGKEERKKWEKREEEVREERKGNLITSLPSILVSLTI
jgi:hypothetical protein